MPVDTLRAAAQAAVDAGKLRHVAKDVGLSPSSLSNFLEQKHEPQKGTIRKLTDWYLSRSALRGTITAAELRAHLDRVLRNLPERPRERGIERVVRLMVDLHRESGAPLPEWLQPGPKPPV